MKIYLAARYSRRVELCTYRFALQTIGYEITSRWLDGKHQLKQDGNPLSEKDELAVEAPSEEAAFELRQFFAKEDSEDVKKADLVISFTEVARSTNSRGGRHVEFGLALAWEKELWIVGPRETIFHCHSKVQQFSNFEKVLENLKVK